MADELKDVIKLQNQVNATDQASIGSTPLGTNPMKLGQLAAGYNSATEASSDAFYLLHQLKGGAWALFTSDYGNKIQYGDSSVSAGKSFIGDSFKARDSSTNLAIRTTTDAEAIGVNDTNGRVRIGAGTYAYDEMLGVNGAIVLGSSVAASPLDGTLDFYSGAFRFRQGGVWVSPIAGSGTANYIPVFASSTTVGDSALYQSGSSVGVGLTDPAYTLEVLTSFGIRSATTATQIISSGVGGSSGDARLYLEANGNDSASDAFIGFFTEYNIGACEIGIDASDGYFKISPNTLSATANGFLFDKATGDIAIGDMGLGTTSGIPLTVQNEVSATNSVQDILGIRVVSSGSVQAGFGGRIRFDIEDEYAATYTSSFGCIYSGWSSSNPHYKMYLSPRVAGGAPLVAEFGSTTHGPLAESTCEFGDIAGGNYSLIEQDGTLYFGGDATVWEDVNIDISRLQSGGSAPGFVNKRTTGIYQLSFDVGESVSGCFEIPHAVKLSSDMYPHIHMTSDGGDTNGYAQWRFVYQIKNSGDTWDAAATTIDTGAGAIQFTASWEELVFEWPSVVANLAEVGAQVSFTLQRISSGASEWAGEIFLETFGFHVEMDTVGSRTRVNK